MGIGAAQIGVDQLPGRDLAKRPKMVTHSGGAARNESKYRSGGPILRRHDEDRGLADMLLDSFHLPRVLPPRLSALVALLKTSAGARSPRDRGP
jgi:hypothetical protein